MVITVSQAPPQNQAPVAHFTFSSDKLLVAFTDESMDTDGDIIAWHWDFGDQQYSNTSNTTHEYEGEGDYTVKLTVTDDDGESNSYIVTLTVDEETEDVPGFEMALSLVAISIILFLGIKRKKT
jgi:PKD repeat protein